MGLCMGIIKPAPFVYPFFAVMYNSRKDYEIILEHLTGRFGEILASGNEYRVIDFTDYYLEEFGDSLKKRFVVMETEVCLESFHRVKIWTNELEVNLYPGEDRSVRVANIDPGYLEPSKLVLYSTKNFSHRVYVGDGIFAEVTLIYERGNFKFLPWTYPDYRWEPNVEFLKSVRDDIVVLNRKRKTA